MNNRKHFVFLLKTQLTVKILELLQHYIMLLAIMIFCRFLDSEVELNDTIQEMHIIATTPELYHTVVELNTVQSLLQLLSHDNTGILDF